MLINSGLNCIMYFIVSVYHNFAVTHIGNFLILLDLAWHQGFSISLVVFKILLPLLEISSPNTEMK